MFGAVLATVYAAPTASTPSTEARTALRRKPVPREATVPTAIERAERPSPVMRAAAVPGG